MRTDKESLPGRLLAFQQRFDDKRDADWAVGMPFVPRSLLGSGVRAIRHRSRQLSNPIGMGLPEGSRARLQAVSVKSRRRRPGNVVGAAEGAGQ